MLLLIFAPSVHLSSSTAVIHPTSYDPSAMMCPFAVTLIDFQTITFFWKTKKKHGVLFNDPSLNRENIKEKHSLCICILLLDKPRVRPILGMMTKRKIFQIKSFFKSVSSYYPKTSNLLQLPFTQRINLSPTTRSPDGIKSDISLNANPFW